MRLRQMHGGAAAGARDRWVTIQTRPEEAVGPSGFPIDAPWADLATVAMAREDVEATERERADQEQAASYTQWAMPYMVEMDPELVDVAKVRRLMYAGRQFDIIGAAPIGRAQGIAILTEAYGKTPTEPAP
jgi:head-tail adaptor